MKKVILFARVSTQHQTLESQIDELKLEAKRMGYEEDEMLLIDFKESAVKLDIEERKGIQALKTSIENDSSIDCVIVYEISRISRQPKMLYEIRDWLISKNVQLICLRPYMRLLEDGINLYDPNDPFFNDICYPYSNSNCDIINFIFYIVFIIWKYGRK